MDNKEGRDNMWPVAAVDEMSGLQWDGAGLGGSIRPAGAWVVGSERSEGGVASSLRSPSLSLSLSINR